MIVIVEQFSIGTLPALKDASPIGGDKKGVSTMFFSTISTISTRDAAISLVGAFLTAILFVTAAVGPLPIA